MEIQSARVSTGSVGASSQAEVTVTWPTPFPDTNYTIMAQVEEGTAANDTLQIKKIVSKTANDCVIRVLNNNASARTGVMHAVGISD